MFSIKIVVLISVGASGDGADVKFDAFGDSLEGTRPRGDSGSGSGSSQNGDVTPRPKGRPPKKNFIRNIKPEAFKRPSSYSCSDAERLELHKGVGKIKVGDCYECLVLKSVNFFRFTNIF